MRRELAKRRTEFIEAGESPHFPTNIVAESWGVRSNEHR
jgi:hypothetical protein